jgi:hypothetical protein
VEDLDRLTPAQTARRLDITPQRVRQLLKAGELGYTATPLGRLVDAADVERLRVERERRHSQQAPVGA